MSGGSAMQRLVQSQLDQLYDSKTGKKRRQVVGESEDPGVTGYVRRCFLSCAEADMTQMSTALVGLLDMMEAAKKIDSTEWETFPPPM